MKTQVLGWGWGRHKDESLEGLAGFFILRAVGSDREQLQVALGLMGDKVAHMDRGGWVAERFVR